MRRNMRSASSKLLSEAMKKVASQVPLILKGGVTAAIRSLEIANTNSHAVFLRIDPPASAKPGSAWSFDVTQRILGQGGCSAVRATKSSSTVKDSRCRIAPLE